MGFWGETEPHQQSSSPPQLCRCGVSSSSVSEIHKLISTPPPPPNYKIPESTKIIGRTRRVCRFVNVISTPSRVLLKHSCTSQCNRTRIVRRTTTTIKNIYSVKIEHVLHTVHIVRIHIVLDTYYIDGVCGARISIIQRLDSRPL